MNPIRVNSDGIRIHSLDEFEGMQQSCTLAAKTLDMIGEYVVPGVTTNKLDQLCHEFIIDNKAVPATLGYRGYPKSSCISVNHVVCHGIPSSKKLNNGDILNIDVTCILDGWFGDTSRMYVAGAANRKAQRLIDVTHQSLLKGIEVVKPGNTFGDIGFAIQKYVESNKMSVVRDFCGHGLGEVFHSAPNVLHYGKANSGLKLEVGMFFTIEPMVNLGNADTKILSDNWTAVTRDKSLSAQFEHSIGVTETGCKIFTLSPKNLFYKSKSSDYKIL
jgi:methionyl aminopeptidase